VHLSRLGIDGRAAVVGAIVGDGGRGRIVGCCVEVPELAVVLVDDLADEGVDGHCDEEDNPGTIRILLGEKDVRMHIPDGTVEYRNAQGVPFNGDPAPELRGIVNSRRKHMNMQNLLSRIRKSFPCPQSQRIRRRWLERRGRHSRLLNTSALESEVGLLSSGGKM
jgi:hypothetical protein